MVICMYASDSVRAGSYQQRISALVFPVAVMPSCHAAFVPYCSSTPALSSHSHTCRLYNAFYKSLLVINVHYNRAPCLNSYLAKSSAQDGQKAEVLPMTPIDQLQE